MARLTVTLPDDLHRALREAAARRGITLGSIVVEGLGALGLKSREDALVLLERARHHSDLTEKDAAELAVRETRAVRQERSRARRR